MRTRPPAQPLPLLGMQTKKKSSPTPMSALMAIKPVGYSLIALNRDVQLDSVWLLTSLF